MSNPRVVIGAGRPNKLAALVCDYTIRKHCPDAEVIHTYARPFLRDGDPNWHRDRWADPCEWLPTNHPHGTMFSFCRHMVPEICGNEGEAIYVDSDMLVYASVREVWDTPMGGAKVLCVQGGQLAVLKVDCAALADWPVRRILTESTYREAQRYHHLPPGSVVGALSPLWNQTDRWAEGTRLLHYTRMPTQPWVRPGHPLGSRWFGALAEAVRSGFVQESVVREEIRSERDPWQAAVYPQPHVLAELEARL